MRDHDGRLSFAPRLPAAIERLCFRLVVGERRLRVEATRPRTTYVLLEGNDLELVHHGETLTVSTSRPVTKANPPVRGRPAPTQPAGRAPARRRTAEPEPARP
jgi:alpha,alpha-trehalose phosphorylase